MLENIVKIRKSAPTIRKVFLLFTIISATFSPALVARRTPCRAVCSCFRRAAAYCLLIARFCRQRESGVLASCGLSRRTVCHARFPRSRVSFCSACRTARYGRDFSRFRLQRSRRPVCRSAVNSSLCAASTATFSCSVFRISRCSFKDAEVPAVRSAAAPARIGRGGGVPWGITSSSKRKCRLTFPFSTSGTFSMRRRCFFGSFDSALASRFSAFSTRFSAFSYLCCLWSLLFSTPSPDTGGASGWDRSVSSSKCSLDFLGGAGSDCSDVCEAFPPRGPDCSLPWDSKRKRWFRLPESSAEEFSVFLPSFRPCTVSRNSGLSLRCWFSGWLALTLGRSSKRSLPGWEG